MPSMKLTCQCCAGMLFLQAARRNATFTSMAIPAYEKGWRLVDDRWFCSEDCVASAARDITPAIPAIESR